jgi:hypothetical protein
MIRKTAFMYNVPVDMIYTNWPDEMITVTATHDTKTGNVSVDRVEMSAYLLGAIKNNDVLYDAIKEVAQAKFSKHENVVTLAEEYA